MAAAPPRRESLGAQSLHSSKQRTSLETLLAMGFSKKRGEKAIAATGNKGVNVASEWLLSHVNDTTIDEGQPREYIVYLCPTGEFLSQLIQLWQKSHKLGWNSAHIYHPHITLCSFFPMADDQVTVIDNVVDVMSTVIKEWESFDFSVGLDLDTKNNSFIGYFLSRPFHRLLEDLMIRIQMEFNKYGVEMKLFKKQFHMTLAFQYVMEQQDKLMELARSIEIPQDSTWEVRIYSRDIIQKTVEVRRILKNYLPAQGDELELNVEDYILMDPLELEKSLDGWYKGSSHMSGNVGFFPGNFTEKCSQMDTWTLHRSVRLKSMARKCLNGLQNNNDLLIEKDDTLAVVSDSEYDSLWIDQNIDVYAKVDNNKEKKGETSIPKPLADPQKLLVVRHAQRCDFNFKNWFMRSFDESGIYSQFDLNCPSFVWPRKSFRDYSKDGPITEIGKAQAYITGEGLKDAGETVSFFYASPSLRCVQTAHQIMKGMNQKGEICIEPGLFEWCGWCRDAMPNFMTGEELIQAGFPINLSYVPYMRDNQLTLKESVETYYTRSHYTTQHILRRHSVQRGQILLVGHSASMDACTRKLRGKPIITTDVELRDVVRGCPYCFVCAATENLTTQMWELCEPPTPPFTHGGIREYEWTTVVS